MNKTATELYECWPNANDPAAKIPTDVTVPLTAVIVGPDYDGENLPPEIAKMFWDAVLDAGFDKRAAAAPTKIHVYVETFKDEPQPWPVFVCVNNFYGLTGSDPIEFDCVAMFYPKNFGEVTR